MSHQQMIVNYAPGEECRVAIVEDGRLEEFHTERAGNVSFVGNIYVGRVTNVEPSIQAAFVDFGLEANGFLHVSDLHPMYFPDGDGETTESIGRKTPRRERPPIQHCLRRGQEIVVQVLKEGISTKGPTLTSYLSIPGRYLVMLPDMDRVGVSRKVEDLELRREMKAVLDELALPEGFGFIMRTAGEGRGKLDLKRDLAYLQRLWKDIERRRKAGDKPRLLYAESDLLMRALRDFWTSDITEIIIDNEAALNRAARFMKIVAPRSSTKLLHYNRPTPIFHAFGIEEQILRTHAREVPLPSGGSLVIDETEALVAIDVNSGKMRSHGDAETTAYRTNIEAVDEICRQLRLRDVGGLILCDLIDMMKRDHRRDIENRFKERLKRDRAASKVLPISQFGIVEMTRQRQKGSLRSLHYAKCPSCSGRGVLKKPDSVADDAMRDLAALLEHDKVQKVEMAVSPRVAGELLSRKRQQLGRLEYNLRKQITVRVSEDIPLDRVNFYAYDATGADVDLERLPKPQPPTDLPVWAELGGESDWAVDTSREEVTPPEPAVPPADAKAEAMLDELILTEQAEPGEDWGTGFRATAAASRRRGKGRQRGREAPSAPVPVPSQPVPAAQPASQPQASPTAQATGEQGGRKRRRRRRRRKDHGALPIAAEGTPIGVPPATQPVAPRGDSWDLPPPFGTAQPPPTQAVEVNGEIVHAPPEDQPLPSAHELIDGEPTRVDQAPPATPMTQENAGGGPDQSTPRPKRRRRRGRRGRGADIGPKASAPTEERPDRVPAPTAPIAVVPPLGVKPTAPLPPGIRPPARSLFGTRRRLKPSAMPKTEREE